MSRNKMRSHAHMYARQRKMYGATIDQGVATYVAAPRAQKSERKRHNGLVARQLEEDDCEVKGGIHVSLEAKYPCM